MASPLNVREEGSQRSWEGRKEVWGGEETEIKQEKRGRGEGGLSCINPSIHPVQRLQNTVYSTDSRSGQRTVCAGSLHYQHQSDVITTVIHLSKQYQAGVCSTLIPSAGWIICIASQPSHQFFLLWWGEGPSSLFKSCESDRLEKATFYYNSLKHLCSPWLYSANTRLFTESSLPDRHKSGLTWTTTFKYTVRSSNGLLLKLSLP